MRSLIYKGPGTLELVEKDIPVPKPNEVLLKVKACGICGSDVHGYLGLTGRRLSGVAMGHEFSAVISGIGSEVKDHSIGERVIVQPINSCGKCRYCEEGNNNLCPNRGLMGVLEIQGAMSEYVCVPEKLLIPMSDDCSFEVGALAEPLTVAYATINKINDYTDKTVLILGSGMIGLCILEMLKKKNPKTTVVSDLSNARLEMALKRGADEIINPSERDFLSEVNRITNGNLFDITIEAVGVESSANQSIKALRKNGVSIWAGVSQREMVIDMQEIVVSQRTIIGSMNYTHQDFVNVVNLLNDSQLDTTGLITDIISLDQAAAMFDELHNNPDGHLKAIIKF